MNNDKLWAGDFGKEYTDRNLMTLGQMEAIYIKRYGLTRGDMNKWFLRGISKHSRILEVGCGSGNQLLALKKAGFHNLYGIEIQPLALEIARERVNATLMQGSVFNIPFKNGLFDLVFTSGVLIHIPQEDILAAMSEIYRCSSGYIWGLEYYAPSYQEIVYRNQRGVLWKADFAKLYMDYFPDLKLSKVKLYKHINNPDLKDAMFLLEEK